MSFSVAAGTARLEYSTRGLNGLFAQRHRAVDPGYLRMLAEHPSLQPAGPGPSRRSRGAGADPGRVPRRRVASRTPSPATSCSPSSARSGRPRPADVRGFSARPLLRFMDNHGWLTIDPPRWWTVRGGSRRYVEAIARPTGRPGPRRLRRAGGATRGRRRPGADRAAGVASLRPGRARHPRRPGAENAHRPERRRRSRLLGAFRYSRNRTLLHTDATRAPELAAGVGLVEHGDERLPSGRARRSRSRTTSTASSRSPDRPSSASR